MKIKCIKRYIFFLILLCAVFGVSGCLRNNEHTADENMTVKKIVIGSDRYEPYIYINADNEFEGIDVELAVEALGRMGYEPEFKAIVWENKKDYLADGEVDCLWGCFSMNGREDEYQWAGPYLYSRQMVAVRMDNDIWKISDLERKIIAVQETSKAEEYFLHSTDEDTPEVELVYCFSSMDEVFAVLRKNYVEAICGHESALRAFVNTAPSEYRLLDETLLVSSLGVAFSKDYDSEFVAELESVLNDMMNDGTTASIVEKYGLDVDKALGREDN